MQLTSSLLQLHRNRYTIPLSCLFWAAYVSAGNEAGIPALICDTSPTAEYLYNNQMCVSDQVPVFLRLDDTGSF